MRIQHSFWIEAHLSFLHGVATGLQSSLAWNMGNSCRMHTYLHEVQFRVKLFSAQVQPTESVYPLLILEQDLYIFRAIVSRNHVVRIGSTKKT